MKLQNKVVLVTGSTSGIGKHCALLFAKEGAKVVINGRNKERGTAVLEEIQAHGGEAIFVPGDVMKEEDLQHLVDETIQTYGKLDVLVNNAGIFKLLPLEEMSEEHFNRIIDTNLKSVFLLTKKAMPHILKSHGNILNISSVAGLKPSIGGYAYNTSKAALNMLTQVLAKNYAAQGIRVNGICPGIIETPILPVSDKESLEKLAQVVPMKKNGEPDDIAYAALFLISDEAKYITAVNLPVDGGFPRI